MILKPMTIDIDEYPAPLRSYLRGAKLYDSSCSPNARVIFINKDSGYFLKIAAASYLGCECPLTRYFYSKVLSANVIEYFFDNEQGWLLTEKIRGDDCTAAKYIE